MKFLRIVISNQKATEQHFSEAVLYDVVPTLKSVDRNDRLNESYGAAMLLCRRLQT